MRNIISHFDKYFEIVVANSPVLIQECHKLRYQAFCIEKGFFNADNIDAFEMDEYDERSIHCLILHKDSGLYAATVRLVLPSNKNISEKYPLENYLTTNCLSEYNKLMNAPRKQVAEISRLLISKHFRQRHGEEESVYGLGSDFGMLSPKQKRQFTAQISLGLFKAIYQLSAEYNIHYWLAFMEPQLMRLLSRIGVHFNHLSEHIKHYGDRCVCFENISEIALGVRRQRPDIWDFCTDEGQHVLTSNVHETAV